MPDPRFGLFCCICFNGLTPETCAVDIDGDKWDLCKGECAAKAGIVEKGSKADADSERTSGCTPTEDGVSR